ncbi:MAG: UDP-N-acetyl-D-glucosamine 2-epimerase, UDP-hydrolysing [Acidobacteria bacterium RIFCSPLOWO2_02_FULL_67_36]|nr:MAG: UDP-N-acetyl-D-glucosamine 2-epimerase, UDP-hydrolysing [Acidobacteria bacterium RIFCSPLOWO2_02_FULL_67_36]OFW20058.1 MAG: UDP-N-acetyl-D-glucosamine 2-epimerase, UDP-hydrolysing [Acidobacteria bacterium RIFCSPLOWO2_12_FULL_66_21]
MRTVAVVTVGRSDYGLYRPILTRLSADSRLRLQLVVGGMHLCPEFGWSVREIEADGFTVAERVQMLLSSDDPEAVSKSIGLGVIGYAQAFARLQPDLLMVLGDRFEMFAAALAALPFRIPVAHIHGGELTAGAIDDALRHSMTKLSHLHFVATDDAARRVAQLGEESWRITICGAPGLDNVKTIPLMTPDEIAAQFGVRVDRPFLLCTFHPVTLEFDRTEWQVGELLAALDSIGAPVVFTQPNADTGGRLVRRLIDEFLATHPLASFVGNFGTRGYFSIMSRAAAMVGNSSSGLIEAPTFALPVVNIGTRQAGRVRAKNVIDVGYYKDEITAGIVRAVAPEFRATLEGLRNPYGDGRAADIVVARLADVALDHELLVKRFADAAVPVHL